MNIERYDGTSDPDEHLDSFTTQVNLYIYSPKTTKAVTKVVVGVMEAEDKNPTMTGQNKSTPSQIKLAP